MDIGNETRYGISTKKVLALAREHFNCSTLEGLLLENNKDSGSFFLNGPSSHWERTLLH